MRFDGAVIGSNISKQATGTVLSNAIRMGEEGAGPEPVRGQDPETGADHCGAVGWVKWAVSQNGGHGVMYAPIVAMDQMGARAFSKTFVRNSRAALPFLLKCDGRDAELARDSIEILDYTF